MVAIILHAKFAKIYFAKNVGVFLVEPTNAKMHQNECDGHLV
jgi:hypothetical protein